MRPEPSDDLTSVDTEPTPDDTRSGLNDPARASAGLGSLMMGLEAMVLFMAVVPIKILLPDSGWAIALVLFLAVACAAVAGLTRNAWAWHVGSAIQLVLLAAGFIHWSLAGVGVIFGVTWIYALKVRSELSRPPVRKTPQTR